jgi:hypothetical protein
VVVKLHHDVTAQFSFLVKAAEPKSEAAASAQEQPEKKHRSFFRRKQESE